MDLALRTLRWSWIGVALLAVAVPTADASVSLDPVRVRLAQGLEPARPGAPTSGTFRVEVARPATLTDFRLEGDGWRVDRLEAPARAALTAGEILEIPFVATPLDPTQPLALRWTLEDRDSRRRFELSEEALTRLDTPGRAEPVARTALASGLRQKSHRPLPGPAPRDADRVAAEERHLAEQRRRARSQGLDPAATPKLLYEFSGRFLYDDPNGNERPAHGVTVRVFDDNFPLPPVLMGQDVTDENGVWSVTASWNAPLDPQPDVFLEFVSENDHVLVRPNGVIPFVGPYTWRSSVFSNVSQTIRDFGDYRPIDESQRPVPHILGSGTKAWEFMLGKSGHDTPKVTYLYPDDRWPAYNQFFQEIYIPEDYDAGSRTIPFQWKEDVQIHEWGHHFINSFSTALAPDYCNGNCDDQTMGWIWEIDCGHCAWCEENGSDAWAEGWPNFLADVVTSSWMDEWGSNPLSSVSYETPGNCIDSDGNPCACDPMITEGFLSALLRDIFDYGIEDPDPDDPFDVADDLALGFDEIMEVTAEMDVTSTSGFITLFRANWPQYDEQLWSTAKNIGFELDTTPPVRATNLASSSHPENGSSYDSTPTFTWTRALDDMSSVRGYSVAVTHSSSTQPDTSRDVEDVTSHTAGPLAPGTWWFHLRTQDRAGNWDDDTAHYGPFTILEPDPADLVPATASGWDWPLVPRPSNDTSSGAVPAPTSPLPTDTWINLRGRNAGQVATPVGFRVHVYVDDVYRYWLSWGVIDAGQGFRANNWGPIGVRGGRHTFEMIVDARDDVPESDEFNNPWAKQWIWQPTVLDVGTPITRSAPAPRTAGWSEIADGSTRWYDADGYRLVAGGEWNAAVLHPASAQADYDLRLHPVSTDATSGFASNLGYSSRPAGTLDAVLTATANLGSATGQKALANDVGVINQDGSSSSYTVEAHRSTAMPLDQTEVSSFAPGETFHLRHVDFALADLRPYTLVVHAPAGETWTAMWFDADFATGDLLDYSAFAITDAEGFARLDHTPSLPGTHGLVLYRDPRDGLDVSDVKLTLRRTPPDLATYTPSGWHSPLVPRPADDGSSSSVPAPSTLAGDAASTYLNLAVRNDSPVAATDGLYSRVYQDGIYRWWLSYGDFGPGVASRFNWGTAWTVPGGRHTLSVRHDQDDRYEEIDEEDNVHGEQWIFEPVTLGFASPVTRSAPPTRTGGWEDLTPSAPLWYNADGVRTLAPRADTPDEFDANWAAVAVMPRASSGNVDLRLHEKSNGAKSGFASNLVYSGAGNGEADFVLVNHRQTPRRGFDAGVLRITGGASYTAEAATSRYLDSSRTTSWGPFTLDADHILHVYELELQSGPNILHLAHQGGDVDWEVGLFAGDSSFLARSEAITPATQAFGAAAEDEWRTYDLPAHGPYCLVVFRADTKDLTRAGSYRITLDDGATAIDTPQSSLRTEIASIRPNPFNPRTEIRYDLAKPADVELVIYNLRGERVRTLVTTAQTAGSHQVVWSGRDDGGSAVASGVYLVHLRAGATEVRRKIALMK